MRPSWLPGAFHAPVAGGALVRGPAGETAIDGRHAHALLRWLTPRMDGGATLAELCAGLDPAGRRAVEAVVAHLVEMGAARDLDAAPDPLRLAVIGVVGGAEASAALVEHLVELGAGRVERWPEGAWDDAALEACDVVVHLGEALGGPESAALDRACRRAGRPLVPCGGQIVGPPAGAGGCLDCAVARLAPPASPPSPVLARLGWDLLASEAALRAAALVRDPAGAGRTARVVETVPPGVASRDVAPLPGCPRCRGAAAAGVLSAPEAGDLPQVPVPQCVVTSAGHGRWLGVGADDAGARAAALLAGAAAVQGDAGPPARSGAAPGCGRSAEEAAAAALLALAPAAGPGRGGDALPLAGRLAPPVAAAALRALARRDGAAFTAVTWPLLANGAARCALLRDGTPVAEAAGADLAGALTRCVVRHLHDQRHRFLGTAPAAPGPAPAVHLPAPADGDWGAWLAAAGVSLDVRPVPAAPGLEGAGAVFVEVRLG